MKLHTSRKKEQLLALKRGDKAAFKWLFTMYEKKLYAFIFSIAKSDYVAEEILQEVFIKLWMKRETLDSAKSLDAFIFKIARNMTYNYLRGVASQEALKRELWKNIVHNKEQEDDKVLLENYEKIVSTILKDIPPQKRNVFILSKQQGKSNQEIADLLGISPKTVKNHLWKTLQIIREQAKPHLQKIHSFILFLL